MRRASYAAVSSSDTEKVKEVLSAFGKDELLAYLTSLGGCFAADGEGRVYPASRQAASVTDILRYALAERGVKMCVATASSPELFVPVLKAGGLYGLFEGFFTVDDAGKNKSFPDIFLLSANKLRLAPERCVAFEDSLAALRAAKRAGMRTVAVYDKASEGQRETLEAEADAFVYGFDEFFE